MKLRINKVRFYSAVTVVEMVVAISIMAIVFAAIVPLFASIRKSWDTKQGNAEVLQNGRVLIDHLSRNLSKAVKITDVSSSSETNGYIQFEDNDANEWRYEIGTDNYVEFGLVGSLSDLAGPVSKLQFTCYDCDDFASPTTDVNSIRLVEIEMIFTNSATLGQDKTFTASVYLRTNWYSYGLVGWWKLDETSGTTAADSSGSGNDGTLVNMNPTTDWVTGHIGGALDFSGFDDYVNLPIGLVINSLTNCTITTWVNWSGLGGDWQRIFDFGTGTTVNMFLTTNNTYTGTPRFAITIAGWTDEDQTTAPGTLPTGWHHISVTIDANNSTHSLYIDGDLVDENTSARYTPSDLGNTNLNWLGRSQYVADPYFNGMLDDVRIYDRVLGAEEISSLVLRYKEFTETKVGSDDTSITISTPSTNEGDLLIAAVTTDGDTSTSIAPPVGKGWTEIDIDNYNNAVTLGAWWKLASASESSSHQFTWSGSQQAYGWIMRFAGHDSDDPIDVFTSYGETSSTPTSPEVTTTVNNCLILRLGAFDDDDITEDDPGLSGHTAITMDESASSEGLVTYEEFTEAKLGYDGTSITVSTPGGTGEGDLLVAAIVTDDDREYSLSPPGGEGWTEIDIDEYDNRVTLGVWWKFADASESPTHQFTWSGGSQAYGWIMRFTGHNPSNPINVSATYGGLDYSYPYRATSPAVTTTVANCLILRIGGFEDGDITIDDTGLDYGHTDITMDESNIGTYGTCSGGAGYIQQSTIGDSGTVTFNLTASEEYRTVTIAIAPATGVSGTVSGGAGYVKQSASGDSGTSTFSLGSSNEAQTLTIAIAPDPQGEGGECGIRP